jgi:predicted transcriptional regulator of viral defense system
MPKPVQLSKLKSELDYNLLVQALTPWYRYPRNKIGSWLKSGELIRVKKGVYVRADAGYCLPTLANMIYGPSYVSQDFALSIHGLIPERVEAVTSMTTQRSKEFKTPVGRFTYEPLPADLYEIGIEHVELTLTQTYLIATPEKAVVDSLWRHVDIPAERALEEYLIEDRRLDLDRLRRFPLACLGSIAKRFDDPTIYALEAVLRRRRKKA